MLFKPKGDAVHDVQAAPVCTTQLAQVAWIQAALEIDRRSKISRRN